MSDAGDAFEKEPPSGSPSKADPWWERKLTLLIVGFLLTGVLGSEFQMFQKKLEWRRQMTYQAYSRKLASMQQARVQLTNIYISVITVEETLENEQNHTRLSRSTLPIPMGRTPAQWHDRLQLTASLFVAAEGFPDPGRIKERLQRVVAAWKALDDLQRDIDSGVARVKDAKAVERYKAAAGLFSDNYDAVRHEMETQTGRFENDNKDLHF